MSISIIAAIGKNRELGKDNRLLWHIPEDLKRFKELTSGHPIIMGRKTFESIGKVLPNRTNIVITSDKQKAISGAIVVHSLQEAFRQAQTKLGSEEIFIIGGGQIFEQALSIASKLYLTIVDKTFDADTFFPDYSMFTKKTFEQKGESGEYFYTFLDLVK